MILNEFDPNRIAIINPHNTVDKIENFPDVVVSCFERNTFQRMVERHKGKEIARTSLANMEIPVYELQYKQKRIAAFNSYVCAPGCVGIIEDLWSMGMKQLVLFGTCGVLNHDIADSSIIVPTSAVRDEGTSYHYAPASDEIRVNKGTAEGLIRFLDGVPVSYTKGKVWSTDALYRETIDKMNRRREQSCIVVDMECSAVAAWAEYRSVPTTHFFYAADHLSEEGWQIRSLSNDHSIEKKDIISELALEYASNL